jgi:hypothetical protein
VLPQSKLIIETHRFPPTTNEPTPRVRSKAPTTALARELDTQNLNAKWAHFLLHRRKTVRFGAKVDAVSADGDSAPRLGIVKIV